MFFEIMKRRKIDKKPGSLQTRFRIQCGSYNQLYCKRESAYFIQLVSKKHETLLFEVQYVSIIIRNSGLSFVNMGQTITEILHKQRILLTDRYSFTLSVIFRTPFINESLRVLCYMDKYNSIF